MGIHGMDTTTEETTTQEITTTQEPTTTTVDTTDAAFRAGYSRIDREGYELTVSLLDTTYYSLMYANSSHFVMTDPAEECRHCIVDDTMAPTTHA